VPIYEYKCLKCRNEFESMQKFSDSPVKKCPSCGGGVKRLISRSSFQLKGSGWYLTDYAKKSSPQDSKESKSTTEPSSVEATSPSPTTKSED
jgi:putative FmdB family regulatory protein